MDLLILLDPTIYVVANYHTELLQMIIALELANSNISKYSLTFDDSCSSLEIKCYRSVYRLSFDFRSLQRAFTDLSRVGLSSQRDGSLS